MYVYTKYICISLDKMLINYFDNSSMLSIYQNVF